MKCANEYEIAWWNEGKEKIVGIDEAGRGPIAGPLVVAAVAFPKGFSHETIYDSKKLSEKKREQLYDEIIALASEYHIEIVSPQVVDELNIYRATQKTMLDLANQFCDADGVLTDAMPLPDATLDVIPLVKGDQKSVSIAAASILAKVTRDRIMKEYDEKYPEYGFKNHKGYPTKGHIEAMHKYGLIEGLYRKSYGPVAKMAQMSLSFDD